MFVHMSIKTLCKRGSQVKVDCSSARKLIGRILLWQWHVFRQLLTKSWIARIYTLSDEARRFTQV